VTDGTRGKVNRLAYAEPVFFQLVSPGHDEIAPFGANPPTIAANIAQKFPILQKLVGFLNFERFLTGHPHFNESSSLRGFLSLKSNVPAGA
jgi:hypothetical protein